MESYKKRQQSEKDWYSRLRKNLTPENNELILTDDWAKDIEPHHEFFFNILPQTRNKDVLVLGCGGLGGGKIATWFAKNGANVFGVDISPEGVEIARSVLKANKAQAKLDVCGGEKMDMFEDESFDLISAYGVLHHLDLKVATEELYRVMKKEAIMISVDAWGGNPLLQFARNYLWYPGKNRSPMETPLTKNSIDLLKNCFGEYELWYFEFFGSFMRFLNRNKKNHLTIAKIINAFDKKLFELCPPIRLWARTIIGRFTKT